MSPSITEDIGGKMTEKQFCYACGGEHEPDPSDSYVIFGGCRFMPPFRCMCCGKEICGRQFAFGRCCGPCDMGACDIHNRVYSVNAVHPHPDWWSVDGKTMFQRFVEAVGAMPEAVRCTARD